MPASRYNEHMPRNALIILGAGASFDLIPISTQGAGPLASAARDLRPPLTKDIFRDDRHTLDILSKYDGARTLAANIRINLDKGEQLEPLLRVLADDERSTVARQFPEIALYLQDFFAKISEYTDQPVNYDRLAHALFTAEPKFEQIAFVTLNYETLLDRVLLPSYFGVSQADIDSYVTDRALLVKLHGSVNWMRHFEHRAPRRKHFDPQDYLELIRSLETRGLRAALGNHFTVQNPGLQRFSELRAEAEHRIMDVGYPAISVPLGTYDPYFACPQRHVEALIEFLPSCRNVLTVGMSARDGDLIKLLREGLPEKVANFHLVDSTATAAEVAHKNFGKVPQFEHVHGEVHTGGFSDFIMRGGIERFIKQCSD